MQLTGIAIICSTTFSSVSSSSVRNKMLLDQETTFNSVSRAMCNYDSTLKVVSLGENLLNNQ